jgi:hypothetical protein
MARLALALALGLVTALAAAAPLAAASDIDTNVGCGGSRVEVCFPVCVTDPCPAYACVHTELVDECRTLG